MAISSFIVIVVLGCHIPEILNDRVQTAVKFASQQSKPVKWFLTGGVKNHIQNVHVKDIHTKNVHVTEASKMVDMLSDHSKWSFVIDNKAKNTAENFYNFDKWMNTQVTSQHKPDVYIVTSKFHYERANKMFTLINKEIKANWLLGDVSCSYCANDEVIHMRNVENDVKKVLNM
jgi:hypothetical protein